MKFSDKLLILRTQRGLTQRQLGTLIGYTGTVIAYMENETTCQSRPYYPKKSMVKDLAAVLCVPFRDLDECEALTYAEDVPRQTYKMRSQMSREEVERENPNMPKRVVIPPCKMQRMTPEKFVACAQQWLNHLYITGHE